MLILLGMFFTGSRATITRLRTKSTKLSGQTGTPAHEGHAEAAQISAIETGADAGSHSTLVDAGTCTSLASYQTGQAGFDTIFTHFFAHGFISIVKVYVGGREACSALPQDLFNAMG